MRSKELLKKTFIKKTEEIQKNIGRPYTKLEKKIAEGYYWLGVAEAYKDFKKELEKRK